MIIYISYQDPKRSPVRIALGVAAIVLALLVIAAVVSTVVWWLNNDPDPTPTSSAAADLPDDAVPLQEAIPTLYQSDTNTIFLVDISSSMMRDGKLDTLRLSLANVVIPYVDPDAEAEVTVNSRAALVPFAGDSEPVIPVIPFSSLEDSAVQKEWLQTVGGLGIRNDGTFIYDAIVSAHDILVDTDDDTRRNVIVLLTDGLDGATEPGQPIITSETSRDEAIAILATSTVHELTLHTIGFGAEADHFSLQVLAAATGGDYIYASRD
jgi:hypothetical protein